MKQENTMKIIFQLLEKKNDYLLEFHKLNTSEIEKLIQNKESNFEDFYYLREIILNAISRLDAEFSSRNTEIESTTQVGQIHKKRLTDLLTFRKKMVFSILEQDATIFSLCDKLNKNSIKLKSS